MAVGPPRRPSWPTRAGMGAIALDTSAAFHNVGRQIASDASRRYLPQFEPFLRAWYSEGAEHRWRDQTGAGHKGVAECGFDQGDPVAPLALALAMRDVLETVQCRLRELTDAAVVVAYLRDVTVVVPHGHLLKAWAIVGEGWHKAGLALRPSKCAAWAAERARAQAKILEASVRDERLKPCVPAQIQAPHGGRQMPAPPTPQDEVIVATRSTLSAAQPQAAAGGALPAGSAEESDDRVPPPIALPPSWRRRAGLAGRQPGAMDGTGGDAEADDIEMRGTEDCRWGCGPPHAAPSPMCHVILKLLGGHLRAISAGSDSPHILGVEDGKDLAAAQLKLTRLWARCATLR